MKLEKREITLNEYDSLQDVFYMQKLILQEYNFFLAKTEKKQTRNELLRLISENASDLFLLKDLLVNVENKEE